MRHVLNGPLMLNEDVCMDKKGVSVYCLRFAFLLGTFQGLTQCSLHFLNILAIKQRPGRGIG